MEIFYIVFFKMDKNPRRRIISSFFVFVARKISLFLGKMEILTKKNRKNLQKWKLPKKVILLENALIFKKSYIFLLLTFFFRWAWTNYFEKGHFFFLKNVHFWKSCKLSGQNFCSLQRLYSWDFSLLRNYKLCNIIFICEHFWL